MPNTTHAHEPDPPASPPSALERLASLEVRAEEQHHTTERLARASEAQARATARLTDEVTRLGQAQAGQGRHLASIDTSIGVLARDAGARAQQDSIHDQQIASVRRGQTLRQAARYVAGGGVGVGIIVASQIIARLILQALGHQ